jgi:hypothetical protein
MVEVSVRDEHTVGGCEVRDRRDWDDPAQVGRTAAEQRVGQEPGAPGLDQDGGVAEVGDRRPSMSVGGESVSVFVRSQAGASVPSRGRRRKGRKPVRFES